MGELGWSYEEARYCDVNAIAAASAQQTELLVRIGLLRRVPAARLLPKLTTKIFDALAGVNPRRGR